MSGNQSFQDLAGRFRHIWAPLSGHVSMRSTPYTSAPSSWRAPWPKSSSQRGPAPRQHRTGPCESTSGPVPQARRVSLGGLYDVEEVAHDVLGHFVADEELRWIS